MQGLDDVGGFGGGWFGFLEVGSEELDEDGVFVPCREVEGGLEFDRDLDGGLVGRGRGEPLAGVGVEVGLLGVEEGFAALVGGCPSVEDLVGYEAFGMLVVGGDEDDEEECEDCHGEEDQGDG